MGILLRLFFAFVIKTGSVGDGDVRLNASSQEHQNHNEEDLDCNVGHGNGDAGSHDAEEVIHEEEKPSKKSKKSKDKGSKSQPISKPQNESCHQNENIKNSQAGPVELPTSLVKTQNEEFSLSSLSQQVAKAREQILNSLNLNNESFSNSVSSSLSLPKSTFCSHTHTCCNTLTPEEEAMLKEENARLAKQVDDLQKQVKDLVNRVSKLEVSGVSAAPAAPKAAPSKKEESDDEDLFASDNEEESAEAERIKAERIAAYAAKKSAKPALIAKSNIILDCKPWDDETDMKQMEKLVRAIEKPGLLWGASKLVEVGYGIKKLQISCVVEDDKISIEELTEQIESNEDFVQSVDIAAFNKV